MFLNAVILILQEILEAALLISVLLTLSRELQRLWPALHASRRWVPASLLAGAAGAWLYADSMPTISEWFDYVGQDVMSALMQAGIVLLALCFGWMYPGLRGARPYQDRVAALCLVGMVALVVTREGSEVILYVDGIMGQPGNLTPVLLGGFMAAGIGLSCGVFLYHGLTGLRAPYALRTALLLLALFVGSMAVQAVMLLTQADWLPYTPELWDSSGLIDEASIMGQLLYALVGYEATPSLLQVLVYFGVIGAVMATRVFRAGWIQVQNQKEALI
jgi:high-affinity iron transporter